MYDTRNSSERFDEVFYLSYLISQRNEPSLKVDNFIKNIKKAILREEDEEKSESALWLVVRYFVLGQNVYSADECSYLLAWSQTLSIYDFYHCFIYTLINLSYLSAINNSDINIILRCLRNINDIKIDNIKSFYNQEGRLPVRVDTSSFDYNNKLHIELLCHNNKEYEETLNSPFLNKFIDRIRDSFQVNTSRRESFGWLQKNYMNFKHVDSIHSLFEICNILTYKNDNKQNAFFTSFLSSNRSSLFFLRDNELKGYASVFDTQEILDLYHDILIVYDRKILGIDNKMVHLEQLYHSKILLRDMLFSVEKIKSYISQDQHSQALTMAVDLYLGNENYVDILPLEELVKDKEWSFYKNIKIQYDAAIVIFLYTQKYNKDDKQWFNMKLCCQIFMGDQSVGYHHDLEPLHFDNDIDRAILFLKNICVLEVLEIDTDRYQTNRSLLEERIKICQKILNLQYDEKVEIELEEIVRKIAIIDGVNTVENIGVTVDYKGYRTIAIARVKDDFIRFHALLEAGIVHNSSNLTEDAVDEIGYNPNEESERVFIKILHDLKEIFLSHPEYGLDYYLSMRIRHGRFIGVLRGPLERKKLITKYSDTVKGYLESEYWHNVYEAYLTPSQLNILLTELVKFSAGFDKLVATYTNQIIQIKSPEKPDGQFYINITKNLLEDMSKQKNIDLFLKQIFDYFFIMVEVCSEQIQKKIKTELAESIRKLIFELQEKITPFCSINSYVANNILDELNHLRTDIDGVIKHVTAWFETSTFERQGIRFFTFKNLVEIGLARTRQSRLDFSPVIFYDIDLNIDDIEEMAFDPMLVPPFSDLFSILFDNISDHSGKNCNIEVHVIANNMQKINNEIIFSVEVRNNSLVSEEKLMIVDKIKDDIEKEKIKSSQEGHSGYHKIKAMGMISQLDFGFEGNEFYTKLILTLEDTGRIEGLDEEAYERLYIN